MLPDKIYIGTADLAFDTPRLEREQVPEVPANTKQNPNGSYDAIIDGYKCRWRYRNYTLMVFIRYHKEKKAKAKHPWKEIYIHPNYKS
jgi:hypothetical protein